MAEIHANGNHGNDIEIEDEELDHDDDNNDDVLSVEAENDFDIESIDEEDNSPKDKPRSNPVLEVFHQASKFFGLKFTTTKTKIKHGLDSVGQSLNDLKLKISFDLEQTWLQHPAGNDLEPIGLWDVNDLDFKAKYYWVPEAHCKEHPKRVPIKILDTEGEKFFANKYLIYPSKKISLPTTVFSPNSATIKDTNLHEYELWGRQGVLDAEITHNLLDLNQDIIMGLSQVFNNMDLSNQDVNTVKGINENLQSVININKLIMQSNYRSKTYAVQTCVKAKTELRSLVLDKFNDQAGTKEILMTSSFFSNSLFGPLPKSLTDIQSNCSGKQALLTLKYSNNFNSNKRKSGTATTSSFVPPAKRGKFSTFNNYRYNNNSNRGNYNNSGNKFNNYTPRYATSSLFPKEPHQKQKFRGGKRGSNR